MVFECRFCHAKIVSGFTCYKCNPSTKKKRLWKGKVKRRTSKSSATEESLIKIKGGC